MPQSSLAIAFMHLLHGFNFDTHPEDFAVTDLSFVDFDSLLLTHHTFRIKEKGAYGTYPFDDHAVMKFDNNCYYAVESAADRTVIDVDGETQPMGLYGTPVAWAVYERQPTLPLTPPPVEPTVYTEATDARGIHYKALQVHRRMYVNKNPANKYQFDEIITHMDAPRMVVEKVPYGTPVYVVMEAAHPIPPTGALYYLDAEAVGDFKRTGRVAHAVGFNKADLSDGSPSPIVASITPEVPAIKPTLVNNVSSMTTDFTVGKLPTKPKEEYVPLSTIIDEPGPCDGWGAGLYYVRNQFIMPERNNRRKPVRVYPTNKDGSKDTAMEIIGFFKDSGHWFGVPLPGEEMVMNDGVKRHLTLAERESYRFMMPCSNLMTGYEYDHGADIEATVRPIEANTWLGRFERAIANFTAKHFNTRQDKLNKKLEKTEAK